jgi:hypothetical protein
MDYEAIIKQWFNKNKLDIVDLEAGLNDPVLNLCSLINLVDKQARLEALKKVKEELSKENSFPDCECHLEDCSWCMGKTLEWAIEIIDNLITQTENAN